MKIYSMTATFGKLENQTLTLQPGLNIIHAPNEWGKSTWCAFLVAMLYGLDTRAKTTKTTLAGKERYMPWSGSPMAGTMRILHRGRDITIQRRTRGRTPMGDFLACETQTGLAVRELTAENCGQILLGVEKSVFRRSGILRCTDLERDKEIVILLFLLLHVGHHRLIWIYIHFSSCLSELEKVGSPACSRCVCHRDMNLSGLGCDSIDVHLD